MENVQLIRLVEIGKVVPGRWQPRGESGLADESLKELADSIVQHGVINPLIVWLNEDEEHELVAGERRLRATEIAGLSHVPVKVITGTPAELHEMGLVDNLQREDLSPVEEAHAVQDLMEEHGYSTREVARKLGWSQAKVSQRLALLGLVPYLQARVSTRVIAPSIGRTLATVPAEAQLVIAEHIQRVAAEPEALTGMTAKRAEKLIRSVRSAMDPKWWILDGEDLSPLDRNSSRILAAMVGMIPAAELAGVLLGLKEEGRLKRKLWEWEIGVVKGTMLASLENCSSVVDVARKQGWSCENCRLRGLLPVEAAGWRSSYLYPCSQEMEEGQEVPTWCDGWIGPEDSAFVIMGRQGVGAKCTECDRKVVLKGSLSGQVTCCPDPECMREVLVNADEDAFEEAKEAEDLARVREKIAGFVNGREGMWLEWPAKGDCEKCVNYDTELGEVPCELAHRPLRNWQGGITSPRFQVLIRERDRLRAPLCDEWCPRCVAMIPELAVSEIALPRAHYLVWLRSSLRAGYESLDWLPMDGRSNGDTGALEFVEEHLEELSDGQLAWLLTVAGYPYFHGVIGDPVTLEVETWARREFAEEVSDGTS